MTAILLLVIVMASMVKGAELFPTVHRVNKQDIKNL